MKKFISTIAAVVMLISSAVPLTINMADKASANGETSSYSWPVEQIIPSFSEPSDTLDALYLRNLDTDYKLLAYTLQGHINKTKPRIIVLNDAEEGLETWSKDTFKLNYTIPGGNSSARRQAVVNLVGKYVSEIDGLVIYDNNNEHSINVAVSIAGVENALVVSSSLANILSNDYELPVLQNLTGKCGTTAISAYNWLFDNYGDKLNDRIVTGLEPNNHFPLIDLAVATKSAVVWLNPANDDEKICLNKFFKRNDTFDNADGNTVYTGWWPEEGAGIRHASSLGIPTVPSDYFENYTVYSGMSREIYTADVPKKPELENKIYVSLILSDGDNIQYNQHAMRGDLLWGSPLRGNIPLGWTISPALIDAAPQMLEYYNRTATPNDQLIAGPNGLGYTQSAYNTGNRNNVIVWPNQSFVENYAKMTNSYFERTGLNIVTIWRSLSAEQASWFANFNNFPSLLGLTTMEKMGRSDPYVRWEGDVPIVYLGTEYRVASYDSNINNVYDAISEVINNKGTSEPSCYTVQFSAWDVKVADLVDLVNKVNKDFPNKVEFVRPDHLMMLMAEKENKNYNASLRAATEASGFDTGNSYTKIVDGSIAPENGWKSSAAGDKWLTVNLGERFLVDRYVLKNAETAYYDKSLNTKDYKIQTSLDGINWTDTVVEAGNTDAIVYGNLNNSEARFVRLYITDPGADGTARVQEFEVYGVAQEIDRGDLKYIIEYAESIGDEYLIENSWNVMQTVIAESKNVYENDSATDIEIEIAYSNLNSAVKSLELNMDEINVIIKNAEEKPESGYTAESFGNMQDSLILLKNYLNDPYIDIVTAVSYVKGLVDSVNALVPDDNNNDTSVPESALESEAPVNPPTGDYYENYMQIAIPFILFSGIAVLFIRIRKRQK